MSRSLDPLLLTLAVSLPGASQALGLGDIHVASELNQPLSAQIDLIGANAEDLAVLNAAVANREIFAKYGEDRPAFLASAFFKVGRDTRGRPVLEVHSTAAFTEPLVSLLVEVRWASGNLVREYSLLLDPPGFGEPVTAVAAAAAARAADAAALAPNAAPSPASAWVTAVRAPDSQAPGGRRVTAAAHDTLGAIARRSGAAGRNLKRTMIAIYRANPDAFMGNINRLRRGASLLIPTPEAIAAIPRREANRDFQAQMAAWRVAGAPAAARAAAPNATPTAAPNAAHAAGPDAADGGANASTLRIRIAALEHDLEETNRLLAEKHAEVLEMQQKVALAEANLAQPAPPHPTMVLQTPAKPVSAKPDSKPTAAAKPTAQQSRLRSALTLAGVGPGSAGAAIAAVASMLALLGGGFAVLRRRLRRIGVGAKSSGDWQSSRVYRRSGRPARRDP